ncbi:MAG TPA: hypothetical protein VE129_17750 [Thermoanaerobaculia bacterium]|nr:hypothetical protein [Thermoanaerobaculia bacterium]
MKSRFTALLTAVFVTALGAWLVLLWGSAFSDVTPFAALAGAAGAALFVGAIVLLRIERVHASALDREVKGLPLRDGALEAASGPLMLRGPTLRAPLTGKPCVAWALEAWFEKAVGKGEDEDRETRRVAVASGKGLAHVTIRSARGEVALLGWPGLEAFGLQTVRGTEAWQGLKRLGRASGQGAHAKDRREPDGTAALETAFVDEREKPDFASLKANEWVVPPGAEVAAVGTWSAERGGLLSARWLDAKHVRLIPGNGAALGHFVESNWQRKLAKAIPVAILLNVPAIGLVLYRTVRG